MPLAGHGYVPGASDGGIGEEVKVAEGGTDVAVALGMGVELGTLVKVGIGVMVGVGVRVGVEVWVRVPVTVGVIVSVGMPAVEVRVGVGVWPVPVAEAVGVASPGALRTAARPKQ